MQLVGDPLASDELFTVEESITADGKLQWCSLRRRLDSAEMGRVEKFVTRLLRRLTPADHHWTWFVDQLIFDDTQFQKPEAYLTLEGCDELLQLGSRISIFEMTELTDLEHYAPLWGRFDAVHGLATQAEFRAVLQCLPLADPMPTTNYSRFSRSANPEGVSRLLELGDPFVEEIANGTRLRLVSRKLSEADLARVVEECRQPDNPSADMC